MEGLTNRNSGGGVRASRSAVVRVLLLVWFAVYFLMGLSGCMGNAADEARSVLEDELSAASQGDYTAVNRYIAAAQFDPNDYGVSLAAFDKYYFRTFAYEVTGMDSRGANAATISLSVTVPNNREVLRTLKRAKARAVSSTAKTNKAGYADRAFAQLSKQEHWEWELRDVDVALSRDGQGNWQVDDPAGLGTAILDGNDARQAAE